MADNNDENTDSNKEPEESSAGQEKPTLVFSADKKKASPLFKIKGKLNDVRQYIAENPEAVLEKVLVVVGLVGSIVAAREAITRGVSIIDGDSKSKYPICNMCGSEMTDFDGVDWYTCPECGNMIKDYGDGEWIWVNDLFNPSNSNAGDCTNCQRSLSGGEYIAPYENGSNEHGYVLCPHCNCPNYQYYD